MHSKWYWFPLQSQISQKKSWTLNWVCWLANHIQGFFSGSQFGWFGCIKTKCSWSRLDDCCQRLGRSNDFSTNINWKDFSRSCLLIKECVRLNNLTSLWRHHYVIIGLVSVYGHRRTSKKYWCTCDIFYWLIRSDWNVQEFLLSSGFTIIASDSSANQNTDGIFYRIPFQIRHFRLTWRSTFSFFYILDWDSLLPMIRNIF